jgi:hypothetical protein
MPSLLETRRQASNARAGIKRVCELVRFKYSLHRRLPLPENVRAGDEDELEYDWDETLPSKSYSNDSLTTRVLDEIFGATPSGSRHSLMSTPPLQIDESQPPPEKTPLHESSHRSTPRHTSARASPSNSLFERLASPRPLLEQLLESSFRVHSSSVELPARTSAQRPVHSHADRYINRTPHRSSSSIEIEPLAKPQGSASHQDVVQRSGGMTPDYNINFSIGASSSSSSRKRPHESSSADWSRKDEKRHNQRKAYANGKLDQLMLHLSSPAVDPPSDHGTPPRSPAIPLITNDGVDTTVAVPRQLRGRALLADIDAPALPLPLRSSIRLSAYQKPIYDKMQQKLQADADR